MAQDDSFERYHRVAETVGFMPSVRKRDNIIQGIVVAIGTLIGAIVGWIIGEGEIGPVIICALAGLVLFGILSGVVLMVIGWVRAARAR